MNYISLFIVIILVVTYYWLTSRISKKRDEDNIIAREIEVNESLINNIFKDKGKYSGGNLYIEESQDKNKYISLIFDKKQELTVTIGDHKNDFNWNVNMIKEQNTIISENVDFVHIKVEDEKTIEKWIEYICVNEFNMTRVNLIF